MDDFRLIQDASSEMKAIDPLFADYERREGIYSKLKWRSRFANRVSMQNSGIVLV